MVHPFLNNIMFFILSKIVFFFIQPFNWILFLFILWLLTKKPIVKKRLLYAIIVLTFIFSNSYLNNEVQLAWQINKSELNSSKKYDAGILLGGLSGYDKTGVGHFSGACDRFIETVKLYRQGIIKKIVVSSGSASILHKQEGEADFLVEELLKTGIPAEDIYKENQSRNTFENATFSKRILDSVHLKPPYVLITSAMHARRAKLVFSKAQLEVYVYPAAFSAVPKYYSWDDYVWPSLGVILDWNGIIKEVIGVLTYRVTKKA